MNYAVLLQLKKELPGLEQKLAHLETRMMMETAGFTRSIFIVPDFIERKAAGLLDEYNQCLTIVSGIRLLLLEDNLTLIEKAGELTYEHIKREYPDISGRTQVINLPTYLYGARQYRHMIPKERDYSVLERLDENPSPIPNWLDEEVSFDLSKFGTTNSHLIMHFGYNKEHDIAVVSRWV